MSSGPPCCEQVGPSPPWEHNFHPITGNTPCQGPPPASSTGHRPRLPSARSDALDVGGGGETGKGHFRQCEQSFHCPVKTKIHTRA